MRGIGIADRNTVAGVVRAYVALRDARAKWSEAWAKARARHEADQPWEDFPDPPDLPEPDLDFRLVVGARLVFRDGTPDIVAYPATRFGWGRLTRLLTAGNRRAAKGGCLLDLGDLDRASSGFAADRAGGIRASIRTKSSNSPKSAGSPRNRIAVSCCLAKTRWKRPTSFLSPPVMPDLSPASTEPETTAQVVEWKAAKGRGDDGLSATLHRLKRIVGDRLWLGATMPYGGKDKRQLSDLAKIAASAAVPLLATNDALYATPDQRQLHDVITCIRKGTDVKHAGRLLEANAERHLKHPDEMARLFRRYPQAIAETERLIERIDFTLEQLSYEYPHEPVPEGWDAQDWLEHLVMEAANERYDGNIPPVRRAMIAGRVRADPASRITLIISSPCTTWCVSPAAQNPRSSARDAGRRPIRSSAGCSM